ncbi:MAG TPA: SpoIIE family protein phosphatase [Spirochaetota bacterium]|nr:SpoIIE family protein phosphatase [Spirochaetota bacterium]
MNKISLKVAVLYIFLAILNISFFTFVIFENQIDLITENSKYQAKESASALYASLEKTVSEINLDKLLYGDEKAIIERINSTLDKSLSEYIVFTENGKVKSKKGKIEFVDEYKTYAAKAFTNMDFLGRPFYINVDEKKFEIFFFTPLNIDLLENALLLFKYSAKDISKRFENLYRLIFVIIIILIIFHIFFAFLINRIIVTPLKNLHKKSELFGSGNLNSRVKIGSKDEIGKLSIAFNDMADSIQKKILQLQRNKQLFLEELQVANEVQSTIFPTINELKKMSLHIFHKPLELVSGDYYDYVEKDENKTCFLVADVCGHGVPAALITMLIKEVFKTSLTYCDDPKSLFETMNDRIYDLINEYSAFFTAFYIEIDDENNIKYVGGGHPPAFLYKSQTGEVVELNTQGFVLGMMRDLDDAYNFKTDKVYSGDKIVIYTDGITEAKNAKDEVFSTNIFKDVVRKNAAFDSKTAFDGIISGFKDFMGDADLQDDATIFLIGIK